MQDYEYRISLRIWHPNLDPSSISERLGIRSSRSWKAGEVRKTPKGNLLDGVHKESYWVGNLLFDDKIKSSEKDLEDCLAEMNTGLISYRNYFKQIVDDGGKVEYFVGLFVVEMAGFSFSPSLLSEIASLSVVLSIDLYCASHDSHNKSHHSPH